MGARTVEIRITWAGDVANVSVDGENKGRHDRASTHALVGELKRAIQARGDFVVVKARRLEAAA